MQSFLFKIFSIFVDFISVRNIKKILLKLKGYWQNTDAPGRMLIMIFFAPSLFVLLWLLFEIAYVIVFTLPGIVIRIISLIFLFCIFWGAAVFFYERLHRMMSEKNVDKEQTIDSEQTGGTQNMENNETENKLRWRRRV